MRDLSSMMLIRDDEGGVYSNFDHELNQSLVQELVNRKGTTYSQHSAWNFCGCVWFESGKFHEQVWRHGSPAEEFEDEDIESLIVKVNLKYGSE